MTKQSEVTAQSKDLYPHHPGAGHHSQPRNRVPLADNSVLTNGDAFKLFMVAYLAFRFFCDFIKPYPRLFLGLGGIQWACLFALLYYSSDIVRWLAPLRKAESIQ